MDPAVLEFLAYHPDSVKVGTHSELLVLDLRLLATSAFLGQCLMVKCQSQTNVTSHLSSVEFAIETPKFDGVVTSEETMEVKEVISTIVIVCISASVVALVPDIGKLSQCLRMLLVDVGDQVFVHLLAEPHSFRLDFKRLVKKVVFRSDYIDEVPNGSYIVVRAIKVDVDTATCVRERPALP